MKKEKLIYTDEQLQALTSKWAKDRFITINGKISTQTLKYVEEMGEMFDEKNKIEDVKDAIGDQIVVLSNLADLNGTNILECKNNLSCEELFDTRHSHFLPTIGKLANKVVREDFAAINPIIGKLVIILELIAKMHKTTVNECWNLAYDEIKDRKGKLLENGNFVKE